VAGEVGIATLYPRHCERSEAIHLSACGEMDCFVASLLAMTEGAIYLSPNSLLYDA